MGKNKKQKKLQHRCVLDDEKIERIQNAGARQQAYDRRTATRLLQDLLESEAHDKRANKLLIKELERYPTVVQAVYLGNERALTLFLQAGESPNVQISDGCTPILMAVEKGYADLVEILLRSGADPTIARKDGTDALMMAVVKKDIKLLAILWHYVENRGAFEINHSNLEGYTLLTLATERCWTDCVRFFLDQSGVDINRQTANGKSALMISVCQGHLVICKKLLAAGANILLEDEDGTTALCLAVVQRKDEIIQSIYQHMDAETRELYVKSRVRLLTKPKESCTDVASFYKRSLMLVLYEVRKHMEDGLYLLHKYKVFIALIHCADNYHQDDELLQTIFHLSACLIYDKADYSKYIAPNMAEQYLEAKGADLSLKIMTHRSSERDFSLRGSAFLPVHAVSDVILSHQWLIDGYSLLVAYIEEFKCTLQDIDFWVHGEDVKAKIMFDRFQETMKRIGKEHNLHFTPLKFEIEPIQEEETKPDVSITMDSPVQIEVKVAETPRVCDTKKELKEIREIKSTDILEDGRFTRNTKRNHVPKKRTKIVSWDVSKPSCKDPIRTFWSKTRSSPDNVPQLDGYAAALKRNLNRNEQDTSRKILSQQNKNGIDKDISSSERISDMEDTEAESEKTPQSKEERSREEKVDRIETLEESEEILLRSTNSVELSGNETIESQKKNVVEKKKLLEEECRIANNVNVIEGLTETVKNEISSSEENLEDAEEFVSNNISEGDRGTILPDSFETLDILSLFFERFKPEEEESISHDRHDHMEVDEFNDHLPNSKLYDMKSLKPSLGISGTVRGKWKNSQGSFQFKRQISKIRQVCNFCPILETASNKGIEMPVRWSILRESSNPRFDAGSEINEPLEFQWPIKSNSNITNDFDAGDFGNVIQKDLCPKFSFNTSPYEYLTSECRCKYHGEELEGGSGSMHKGQLGGVRPLFFDSGEHPDYEINLSSEALLKSRDFAVREESTFPEKFAETIKNLVGTVVRELDTAASQPVFELHGESQIDFGEMDCQYLLMEAQSLFQDIQTKLSYFYSKQTGSLKRGVSAMEYKNLIVATQSLLDDNILLLPNIKFKSKWSRFLDDLLRHLPIPLHTIPSKGGALTFSSSAAYSLNSGTCGTYIGVLSRGLPVVIKNFSISSFSEYSKCSTSLRRICSISRKHQHISYIYDAIFCPIDMSISIVRDLCENTVAEYLRFDHEEPMATIRRQLVGQFVQAMKFLHDRSRPIIHGRLKPSNILVTLDGKLKLVDLGLTSFAPATHGIVSNSGINKAVGFQLSEHCWRSQETIAACNPRLVKLATSTASDVQVAGMLVYYIQTNGRHPFGRTDLQCQKNIVWGDCQLGNSPEDQESRDLILQMISHNPLFRPSMVTCSKHPYFWSFEKRFHFLLILERNLDYMKRNLSTILGRLQQSCLEAREWMFHVEGSILKYVRGNSVYKNTTTDLLHFAAELQKKQEDMPASLKKKVSKPEYFIFDNFPTIFMSVYHVIREEKMAQLELNLHTFFRSG